MTESGDYPVEMPRTAMLDERSIEAILAGDAGAQHQALSAFVAEMRSVSAGSVPQPSPALSSVFLHGVSTENGDLSATTASNVTGPAPQAAGLPKWRKYSMAVKQFVAGLSIAGKLALGVGVAAAATTGAGTAGVLPDSAQHQFARAFDAIAPFDVTDPHPESALGPPERHESGDVPKAARRNEEPANDAPPAPTTTRVDGPRPTEPPHNEQPRIEAPHTSQVPAPEQAPATTEVHREPTTTVKKTEPPATTTTRPPETAVPVTLSITCAQNAAAVSVTCSWTVLTPTETAQYALFRMGPDGNRVVFETGVISTSSFVDVHVEAGHTYSYMIVARNGASPRQALGHSAYVPVSVAAV